MKICIHSSGGQDITIPFPNAMLFSPTVLKLVLKFSGHRYNHEMPQIPPAAIDAVCTALKNYHRTHGSWELVHVESYVGDTVIITL